MNSKRTGCVTALPRTSRAPTAATSQARPPFSSMVAATTAPTTSAVSPRRYTPPAHGRRSPPSDQAASGGLVLVGEAGVREIFECGPGRDVVDAPSAKVLPVERDLLE